MTCETAPFLDMNHGLQWDPVRYPVLNPCLEAYDTR
jgi:hypothetical protein